MVRLAVKLQYELDREDLTGLVEALRKLPKNHRAKLIIMGYSRLVEWIDWQTMRLGAPLAIVDPRGTLSECQQCRTKLKESGYRRLKCPRCGFEADRDVVGELNIRKRALKMLRIKANPGEFWLPHCPQMTDVIPNRWGELMILLQKG
jgi:transposase